MNVRGGNIITLEVSKNFPIIGYLKVHPHSSPPALRWIFMIMCVNYIGLITTPYGGCKGHIISNLNGESLDSSLFDFSLKSHLHDFLL